MYKKLLVVQKKIGAISKDSTNPFFKSKYFDINKLLDVVKPIMNEEGLLLLQPLSNIDGIASIKTIIIDVETGDTIENNTPLTQINDSQKMGSAITYFRRYSLQSLLGLQAEDDDGNKASKKKEEKGKSLEEMKVSIDNGFAILKYTAEDEKKMRDEFLPKGSNIDDIKFLLDTLRKKAKNKGAKK